MNESDARRAVFVRAFETPPVAPWSEADAAWVGAEAAREQGEAAAAEALIAARARLASARLVQREPRLGAVLAASAWPKGLAIGFALLAGLLGLATDAIGSSGRINLLAPPLLGLLAWNLCVYALLGASALRGGQRRASSPTGPLRRLLAQALQWMVRRAAAAELPRPPVARFVADWLAASRGLGTARISAVLHAAAAAFALGLLASLYLRGIAFEYRAGWDSTFLSPEAVQRLLSFVLGPAARLSAIALPDVDHVARLRFAIGPGENAAAWIHLFALTVALLVLLPRALLAALAAWRARRLAAHFPLPLSDGYFERLLRAQRGESVVAVVRPYSYQLPRERRARIGAALERELGPRVQWQLAPSVAIGSEDEPERGLAAPAGALSIALFALSATPERESHGAFLDALRRSPGTRLSVLIDEAGWRQRFPGAEGEKRLAQRRELWRRWLREQGEADEACWFVDLAPSEVAQ